MVLISTKLRNLDHQKIHSMGQMLKLFWMFSCFYAKYQSLHPYKRYSFVTRRKLS